MQKFYDGVIRHRKIIMAVYLGLFLVSIWMHSMVLVNYDMNSYLPEDSPSTVGLEVMEEEFDGGIPNARIMVSGVSIPEALEYKEEISKVEGVSEVTWLDDAIDVTQPIEIQNQKTVETYYKDETALFQVTIQEEDLLNAVSDIRDIIGEENAMTGSAVSTAIATESTVSEIRKITVIAIIFVLLVLMLTTEAWAEPFIILAGIGVAVVINAGTNLIFGEISFVTNAAGNILQLAVSLDYSVFLIHRFEECRKEEADVEKAMSMALCKSTSSILSSGLTTVIGFFALTLMRFGIGPDLGLALAKGIGISLLSVFLFMPGLILLGCSWMDRTAHRPFLPEFRKFGKVVQKITIPVACILVVLMVPSYLASIHNDYYYGSSHIFGEGTKLGDDTALIKETFGKGDTYVLLVPKGDTALETELSGELKQVPEITSVISFVDNAGAQVPQEYLGENTRKMLESEHYSRMVLSVDVDYEGKETEALVEKIRGIAEKYYPKEYYLAGEGISTYDLMDTVTTDMLKVNLIAIAAVFLVLLITMRSLVLPVILVLTIETAIWLNLSMYYYMDQSMFYIAYLIISSVQLGATVDYAILFTERYKENRISLPKKESLVETVSDVTVSILTSGITLTVVGFLLGNISTHGLLSQLGYLIGKGTLCSLVCVLFALPGFLYLFDRFCVKKTQRKKKEDEIYESE